MQYWLFKSEAECYGIDHLKRDKSTLWTEVRNYQARNFMKDMEVGDLVLFYHSNAGVSTGIAGIADISKEALADPTQFERKGEYFDEKSTAENPRWLCVEIKFKDKFKHIVTLQEIKNDPAFSDMALIQRGNRLSVMPVQKKHFNRIVKLGL